MSEREIQRAAAAIEKVRSLRVRPPRDTAAAGAVGEVREALEREIKQTGGMGEAWRALAPATQRAPAPGKRFQRRGGAIATPAAGAGYRVEQWLRGGGRAMLAGCAPGTIKRVVVR